MSKTANILESYRPQCRATDGQGRRCRARVVWDAAANRPVSTRCESHGGLADADFIGRQSPAATERLWDGRPHARAGDGLASVLNALRTKRLDRSFAVLPALFLAAVLLISAAGPALAYFESAVADFERGAYGSAQTKFEAAVEAGDERALPYLERIRQRLADESRLGSAPTLVTDAGPVTGSRTSQRASGNGSAGTNFMELFGDGARSEPQRPGMSDIVAPLHGSTWSALFHLPGDATVIGLQHAAQFFDAHSFSQDLRVVSRSSNHIALSVLAGIWWLVLIRVGIGIGMGIGRLTKAAATRAEIRRYG